MEERPTPMLSSVPPVEAGMGALWGLALWLGGWVLQHAFVATEPTSQPMFWVLASAPFWFGGLGWLAGDRSRELHQALHQLREAAEASLRELNRREFVARATLQSTHDVVLLVKPDGFVVEATEGATRVFGLALEQVVGAKIEALLPDHDRLDRANVVQRRSPTGDRVVLEWKTRGRHADGTLFAADVQIVTLAEQSLQVFLLREASARMQREERLAREAEESQKDRWVLEQRRRGFVVQVLGDAMRYEVEHQLTELDARGAGAPPALVGTVQDSAHRMLERLDQLWNLAMWERSSASPTVGPVELQLLLSGVANEVRPVARRYNNRVLTEVRSEVQEIVSDASLLSCALRNLVLHALRRVEGGTVRVEVAREAGRGTDWVAMFVEDDGAGLTPQQLEEIQGCFALSADLTPPPDMRAGLALSHRLARSLGGHVAVHPSDSGNVLSLRIPMEPSKVKIVPTRPRQRMDSVPPTAIPELEYSQKRS
jgi:PAS domain S-box-containing protein